MGSTRAYRNLSLVVLSGGVGGARLSRGLIGIPDGPALTVVVNVGDDDDVYGVRVCADLDTVTYTLAGIVGRAGWGIANDSFTTMSHLETLGVDTTFRLGDRDLATCLARTAALRDGRALSAFTTDLNRALGVAASVIPATDDLLRTRLRVADGSWLPFQEYFVGRGHQDLVDEVVFEGANTALPAPGVVDAVAAADAVVIAPSNPILSIWPMLAVPELRRTVRDHPRVIAVSPLIGGAALRGPAADLLTGHGFPPGNAGVLAAYAGLIDDLVVDESDAGDVATLADHPGRNGRMRVHATSTRISESAAGATFGEWLCRLVAKGVPVP